jgi:hypothetical protein
MPVTTPVLPTVAIAVLSLLQMPPAIDAVRVVVAHNVPVPVIDKAAGSDIVAETVVVPDTASVTVQV